RFSIAAKTIIYEAAGVNLFYFVFSLTNKTTMSLNNNKVALVTGATKGMGKAISFALVKEGYTLIACARKQDTLEQLQNDIKDISPDANVHIHACDFLNPAQLEDLLQWVDRSSLHVDVLVNNVGLFIPGHLLEEAPDMLAKHMQVN